MPDGLYSGVLKSERLQQGELTRHRLLVINTATDGSKNGRDASSYGSVDPNNPLAQIPANSQEGGPHFTFSPQTPDGRPTLGFEFCLYQRGMDPASGPLCQAAVGDFTVTVWCLIGSTMLSDGSAEPVWAAFQTVSGVGLNQLFHSFDVNATCIRFQIGNIAVFGSIGIALAEL